MNNISSYLPVKKLFFVGNSGFFVDNCVKNMWITPADAIDRAFAGAVNLQWGRSAAVLLISAGGTAAKIFSYIDNVPGPHGDDEISGPAVLF